MAIKLIIPGEPVAKARPRITEYGAYTPAKTKNYESLVKELYFIKHGQTLLDGELSVNIKAYFKIPKSISKKKREMMINKDIRPIKRPDLDNVMKSITDALNGVAYKDDSQIVSANIEKFYSEEPRVDVVLEQMKGRK